MRDIGRAACACLLVATVSSCNTSEALTPRADVGTGSTRSTTPVTQADTERMAGSQRGQTETGDYAGRRSQPGPQNSLEAQAEALQSGNSVSPASSGPPPQWQGQEPRSAEPQGSGEAAGRVLPQQNSSSTAASGPTIRFLPIIGAPVQAVTPLSRRLGSQARASGLTIRPSSDPSTEHMLKGYFSAFANDGKVTVVYVWDVLDNSGARLHRMQGQESVQSSGQDPWTAVPASTMEGIAAKTIQDYVSWRQSRQG